MANIRLGVDVETKGAEKLKGVANDLEDIGSSSKKADSSLAGMAKSVAPMAGAFAAMGAAVALVSREIVQFADMASKIEDLSAKTGLSTDAIQELGYAAEQTGASFEDVSRATLTMERNLAAGKAVFDQLGLSVRELRGMKPEDAFLQIAEAIRKIEDPSKQAQAAMLAFGKAGLEILPAIRDGLGEAAEEARNLGLVLDKDLVKAGDRLGDSLSRLGKSWDLLKAQASGFIVEALRIDEVADAYAHFFAALRTGEFKKLMVDMSPENMIPKAKGLPDFGGGATGNLNDDMTAEMKILAEGLPKAISVAKKELAEFSREQEKVRRATEDAAKALEAFNERVAIAGFKAKEQVKQSMADMFDAVDDRLVGPGGVAGLVEEAFREDRLRQPLEAAKKATFDWGQALQDVNNTLQLLGISSASTMGVLIGGMTAAAAAGDSLNKALADGATNQQKFAAGIQGLGVAVAAFKNESILAGAASGAAFGSAFGVKSQIVCRSSLRAQGVEAPHRHG